MLCINEKDWWCIIGYQVDGETIIMVSIKTPKTISQYDNNSAYKVPGCSAIEKLEMRLSSKCLKS